MDYPFWKVCDGPGGAVGGEGEKGKEQRRKRPPPPAGHPELWKQRNELVQMNREAGKQRCPATGPLELWRAASPCHLPRQLVPPPPTRPRPTPTAGGPQLSPHARSDPPVSNPGAAPAPGRPTPASLPAGSSQKPAPPTSPGWCPHERSGQ